VPVPERVRLAAELGAAHRTLHRPAPPGAPVNPVRGVPLAGRAAVIEERLASVPEAAALEPLWRSALLAPVHDGPPLWLHGDPHPGNLLADERGGLAAMLDFGDVTAGDPATDLAIGWLAFDSAGRAAYRQARQPDDAIWARARGWAVALTTTFLLHSDDNPPMLAIGEHALRELLAE
jgi:aminoglycoside phosphotransferase (APT) family kinase protein